MAAFDRPSVWLPDGNQKSAVEGSHLLRACARLYRFYLRSAKCSTPANSHFRIMVLMPVRRIDMFVLCDMRLSCDRVRCRTRFDGDIVWHRKSEAPVNRSTYPLHSNDFLPLTCIHKARSLAHLAQRQPQFPSDWSHWIRTLWNRMATEYPAIARIARFPQQLPYS